MAGRDAACLGKIVSGEPNLNTIMCLTLAGDGSLIRVRSHHQPMDAALSSESRQSRFTV